MEEKAQTLPFKVVIDDYLVGDVWLAYSRGERTYRGMALADNMKLGDKLAFRILSLETSAPNGTRGQYLRYSEVNQYLRDQEFSRSCSEEALGEMLDWAAAFYEIEMRQGMNYAATVTGAEFAFALDGDSHVELVDITLREQMPVAY